MYSGTVEQLNTTILLYIVNIQTDINLYTWLLYNIFMINLDLGHKSNSKELSQDKIISANGTRDQKESPLDSFKFKVEIPLKSF